MRRAKLAASGSLFTQAALLAGQALWETGLAEPNPDTLARNEKKRQRVRRWMRTIVERG
jgi:hypothetical protein